MTDFVVTNGRLARLKTDNPETPEIGCEQLFLCANIWSLALAAKVGLKLPLLSAEPQYVVSTPVEALAYSGDESDRDQEIIYPTAPDLDVAMFYRHH